LELVEGIEKKEDSLVNKHIWQHFAFSYHEDTGEASFFLNTVKVMKGNTQLNLKNINANPILACLQYTGDFTEFRIWRYVRTEKEIREEYTYPLGIIAEKKSAIKVIISKGNGEDKVNSNVEFDNAKIETKAMEFGDFSIAMPGGDSLSKGLPKDSDVSAQENSGVLDPPQADTTELNPDQPSQGQNDIVISPPPVERSGIQVPSTGNLPEIVQEPQAGEIMEKTEEPEGDGNVLFKDCAFDLEQSCGPLRMWTPQEEDQSWAKETGLSDPDLIQKLT